MALSPPTQAAIILSVFLIPILTYLYLNRRPGQETPLKQQEIVKEKKKKDAGPLPPPTEITNLFIHPVKSCHGIAVKKARLLPTGLDLDRQWMWVSYPDMKFLTIRNLSKMTLIRPSYDPSTDTLTITAPSPSSPSELLSLTTPAHPSKQYLSTHTTPILAEIWGKRTPAHAYPTSLTSPFDSFFARDVRLVYKSPFDTASPRALGSNGAEPLLGRAARTCFPDMMPLLIGSEASLGELNARLREAEAGKENPGVGIDVRRFRPNVLVRGGVAWDEDRWKTVRIEGGEEGGKEEGGDGVTLDVTQRCARCQVPNVDPETGDKHKRQPWDELMKYRRVDEGIKFKPCFGMLCVPREDHGGSVNEEGTIATLQVGMKLHVLEVTAEHRYIPGF